jgi:aldose 1-epimerase
MAIEHPQSPFVGEIVDDVEIGSTVISLQYKDPQHPERNLSVGIAPELGSNLFRFRVGEHDIIHCERELLKSRDFTGDFVLWPLPNRVRDKRYTYRGHDYSLADVKRPQGNTVLIHGLVFDRPWHYDAPHVWPDAVSVTTYVDINKESGHWYEAYPFDSRLSMTYTLTSTGINITYRVQNNGSNILPFGFALHPYFSTLAGKDDTYIHLPAATLMEADDDLLPTGRLLDVTGIMYAMFDLRTPVPVSHLKVDHVYTNLQPRVAAVIDYRTPGIQINIMGTDDFTHAVVFTPPASDPYFCLEHQTCSTDAINFDQQGGEHQKMAHLLEVQPGEQSSGTLNYSVSFSK